MKTRTLLLIGVIIALVGPSVRTQEPGYPVELIPPGKGPFTFPQGYQTPWEKIQMLVTSKMSPNLFVLHGSEGLDTAHPDASGGRLMVLFGPDGVLMVDTGNRQVAEKTLAATRAFTSAPIKVIVNTHPHSDHTGGNAYFAKQGGIIFAQENLRLELMPRTPATGRAGRRARRPPRASCDLGRPRPGCPRCCGPCGAGSYPRRGRSPGARGVPPRGPT